MASKYMNVFLEMEIINVYLGDVNEDLSKNVKEENYKPVFRVLVANTPQLAGQIEILKQSNYYEDSYMYDMKSVVILYRVLTGSTFKKFVNGDYNKMWYNADEDNYAIDHHTIKSKFYPKFEREFAVLTNNEDYRKQLCRSLLDESVSETSKEWVRMFETISNNQLDSIIDWSKECLPESNF